MSQLNVGTVNATNINATGELDVDAKIKIPQKTTAQLPTSGVVAGEMVQNTTTNKMMVYDGSGWKNAEGEGRQYRIQCWGAGGGGGRAGGWSYGAEGGGGGYVEADINGLASNTQTGSNPGLLADGAGQYTIGGQGMTTAQSEALGDAANNHFNEMGFSIEKVTVTAKSRALKAEYSLELAQDLKAVHGLDAESELANILSTEVLAEINREVVRTVYKIARPGAQNNTATAGVFD